MKNPLNSNIALQTKLELTLTTKEKEKKANESPILKSIFDYKGNSKLKEQNTMTNNQQQSGAPATFGGLDNFINPFSKAASALKFDK